MKAVSSGASEFPRLLWGLAVFCLILAAYPHRMFDWVWWVTPPTPTLLGTSMWTPRLASLFVFAGFGKVPLLICAMLLSAALTFLIHHASRRLPIALVGVWYSLVAVCFPIEHTLVLVLTAIAIGLGLIHSLRPPGRRFIACAGLAILTASLTSRVAWPVAMLTLSMCQPLIIRDRVDGKASWILVPVAWIFGLIGAIILVPGISEQLVRPLMFVVKPHLESVFPSSSLIPEHQVQWILLAAFLALLMATMWKICGIQSGNPAGLAVVLGLSIVACGGWHDLMLSGCSLAAGIPLRVSAAPCRKRLVPVGCLAAAMLLGGIQWQRFGIDLLAARIEDRRVDPAQWNVGGRVLLTNLEQSADWLSEDPQPALQQLLDDRACPNSLLKRYAAACLDWKNSRGDSYLRADGSWGGYNNSFRDWNPSLIVTDASDALSLRHLSIDPKWKVMGIDSQRVIFGNVDDAALAPQIREASRLLLHLEFPGRQSPPGLFRTLMLGTRVDAREVAMVLNALRLPYAALRVLPADENARTTEVRTICHAELAHRCRSHSGQVSLLDQYRAMIGLRSMATSWTTSKAARRRVQRTIDSLALDDIGSVTPRPRQEDEVESTQTSVTHMRLRSAFAAGETETIRRLLAEMPATSERRFFEAIMAANDSGPEASMRLLEQVTEESELPVPLRHEGYFYLGCLAIETGQSIPAVSWLRRSIELLPSGLFAPLAEFFAVQLTAQ